MLGKKCEGVRCAQEPTNCQYPEPHQSRSWSPSHFLKIQFYIIFPSTPESFRGLFPSSFPTKLCTHLFSPICAASPANLIVHDLITRIIFVPDLYFRIIRTHNNMGIFGAVRFLQTLLLFLNVQHRIIMLIFVTQIMDHYSHTV